CAVGNRRGGAILLGDVFDAPGGAILIRQEVLRKSRERRCKSRCTGACWYSASNKARIFYFDMRTRGSHRTFFDSVPQSSHWTRALGCSVLWLVLAGSTMALGDDQW